MSFTTLDYRQVRANILRDIQNANTAASVGSDSDFYIRATATGSAVEGLYEHQKWIARQLFPDTADIDYLEAKHANPRGLPRKLASAASGTVLLQGAVNAPVPIGTQFNTNDGNSYVTTVAGVIGAGGTLNVAAQSTATGLATNQNVGTIFTLTNPPNGVQPQGSIVGMSGGTDIETQASLVARVLFDIQMPASGGATHDYYTWAMSIAGVTDAYVFTQRRSANSVDVVIETTGGLPSAALIAAVQAYINTKFPPGADVLVMAPTLVSVPVTGVTVLSGVLIADVLPLIEAALQNYFSSLSVGSTVRWLQITSLITSIPGVLDVVMTTPTSNIITRADNTHSELAVLGAVNLT